MLDTSILCSENMSRNCVNSPSPCFLSSSSRNSVFSFSLQSLESEMGDESVDSDNVHKGEYRKAM